MLGELLYASEKQWKFVQAGDTNLLLRLLAEKQKIFHSLEKIERELDPYRNIEPKDRQWENEQDRLDCDTAIQECNRLLEKIMETDKRSEAELIRQKDEIQKELNHSETSGRAAASYLKQNVPVPSPRQSSVVRFDFSVE